MTAKLKKTVQYEKIYFKIESLPFRINISKKTKLHF